jgi:isopentenyl phosphate kinase
VLENEVDGILDLCARCDADVGCGEGPVVVVHGGGVLAHATALAVVLHVEPSGKVKKKTRKKEKARRESRHSTV